MTVIAVIAGIAGIAGIDMTIGIIRLIIRMSNVVGGSRITDFSEGTLRT